MSALRIFIILADVSSSRHMSLVSLVLKRPWSRPRKRPLNPCTRKRASFSYSAAEFYWSFRKKAWGAADEYLADTVAVRATRRVSPITLFIIQ